VFHNEALQVLDAVVAPAVEGPPQDVPLTSPAVGDCYIIGDTPSGAWAGNPQALAAYSAGGWRFVPPVEGLSTYVRSDGVFALFRSGAWELGEVRGSSLILDGDQVVGSRAAAIASASGGTIVDVQARAVIDQILTALRQHGLIAA
jgi:hypothetical protein